MKTKGAPRPLHPCLRCKKPTSRATYCTECLRFIRKVPVGKKSVETYIDGKIIR